MKRIIIILLSLMLALSFTACSFFTENENTDIDDEVFDSTQTENPDDELLINSDEWIKALFPNGIAEAFRDGYDKAESDETYGTTWSIYYKDMTQNQYFEYLSKLLFMSSYKLDIMASDRISADVLLKNAVSTQLPANGVIRTCVDDPDYAYLNVYYFTDSLQNSNGFEYTVRVDITLYNVEKSEDDEVIIPDNSAKKGSVIGMDKELADKVYFNNDSGSYIVTESNIDAYGGYKCVEKYAFDYDDEHLIRKRVRLEFSNDLNMLSWCYDNTAEENNLTYLDIVTVSNVVYATENIEKTKMATYTKSELKKLLTQSGISYYEGK